MSFALEPSRPPLRGSRSSAAVFAGVALLHLLALVWVAQRAPVLCAETQGTLNVVMTAGLLAAPQPEPSRPTPPPERPPKPGVQQRPARPPVTSIQPVRSAAPAVPAPAPADPHATPVEAADSTAQARPAAQTAAGPAPAAPAADAARAGVPAPLAPPAATDARSLGCEILKPPYPRLSRLAGEAGTTVVRIAIDAQGRIGAAVVEQGSGFARLDAAALKAARASRCSAGVGAAQATVPFHFQLD